MIDFPELPADAILDSARVVEKPRRSEPRSAPRRARWLTRSTLFFLAVLLAALAVLHEVADGRERSRVEGFLERFSVDRRRPDLASTAAVEATADLAAVAAVRAAVLDLAGSATLRGLDPTVRELWLKSVEQLPEEVAAARLLALRAFAARPAWAYHAVGLADLVVAGEWRVGTSPPALWMKPLLFARKWAPQDVQVAARLAAAGLERWPALDAGQRRETITAVKEALRDGSAMRQLLPTLIATVGREEGLGLMPESTAALAEARHVLRTAGGFEESLELYRRWESADREERRRAAERIESLLKEERVDQAAEAARAFLQAHPGVLLTDAQGKAELRLLLRALSDGSAGAWMSDPRAVLVRFFLDGPRSDAVEADLLRAIAGLLGVPGPVRARLSLAAGDEYGWKGEIADEGVTVAAAWTPFFVDLARRRLAEGDRLEAQATVARIPRFSQGECEALLVRREVARVREDAPELARLAQLWPGSFPEQLPLSTWSAAGIGGGTLPVCIDPDRDSGRMLLLRVRSTGRNYVWWGWDGGREGTRIVDEGESVLEFPLTGLAGRRVFGIGPLIGPGVSPVDAQISGP